MTEDETKLSEALTVIDSRIREKSKEFNGLNKELTELRVARMGFLKIQKQQIMTEEPKRGVIVRATPEIRLARPIAPFVARILALGHTVYGKTQEEALDKLQRMFTAWVNTYRQYPPGKLEERLNHSGVEWLWAEGCDSTLVLMQPYEIIDYKPSSVDQRDVLARQIRSQATRHRRASTDPDLLIRDLEFIEGWVNQLIEIGESS